MMIETTFDIVMIGDNAREKYNHELRYAKWNIFLNRIKNHTVYDRARYRVTDLDYTRVQSILQ